jgi:nucleoside-diphosphate-sugar epimerase
MASFKFTPIISPGETILITGANGYIASAVANQALAAGYRVKGTVRNLEKAKKLQEIFDKKYGSGNFQLVKVENIIAEGAFDEAVKGCSGFLHIAVDTSFATEPEPCVGNAIKSTIGALKSATTEPKVKRFVLTSSTMAAVSWKSDDAYEWGIESWNEEYVKVAYEPPFGPEKGFAYYSATKTRSEQEAWKWVRENKAKFEFNAMLPAANFGKSVTGDWQSTGSWPKMVFDGDWSFVQMVPPRKFLPLFAFVSVWRD